MSLSLCKWCWVYVVYTSCPLAKLSNCKHGEDHEKQRDFFFPSENDVRVQYDRVITISKLPSFHKVMLGLFNHTK